MRPPPNPKAVDRKRRLALPDAELPAQPAEERVGNFEEVRLPLDFATARAEAERCIQCPAQPCVKACPADNDIPYALWLLEHGEPLDAASVFRRTSTMPDVCGRVCPQGALCEGVCPYVKQDRPPVPIGRLEAFVADYAETHGEPDLEVAASSGRRAAVVGAGPAGLTVAEHLARAGHSVTVFDGWPSGGGILRYGIPSFKMSHDLVDRHTDLLERLGVQFQFGTWIGKDLFVDDLLHRGFEAVFLGFGAGAPRALNLAGVDLHGVHYATPFLIRTNVPQALRAPEFQDPVDVGRHVAVIGGGDTAMDCVRTSVRLGADRVTCFYRRTEEEMPGNDRDRALARQEGVAFEWLVSPERFEGDADGRVTRMECVRMELRGHDRSGRRSPVPIPDSGFSVPVDTVVLALGYEADPRIPSSTPGLAADDKGLLVVNADTGQTSRPGVYAGGDAVLGPALVVNAVAHGKRAAEAMHGYLMDPARRSRHR